MITTLLLVEYVTTDKRRITELGVTQYVVDTRTIIVLPCLRFRVPATVALLFVWVKVTEGIFNPVLVYSTISTQ